MEVCPVRAYAGSKVPKFSLKVPQGLPAFRTSKDGIAISVHRAAEKAALLHIICIIYYFMQYSSDKSKYYEKDGEYSPDFRLERA